MYVQTLSYGAKNFGQSLVHELTTTGFAVLENHPIPHELLIHVLNDWQQFFDSPSKFDYLASHERWGEHRHHHGFFPYQLENAKGSSEKNLLEYFHYYQHLGIPSGLSNASSRLYDHLWSLTNEIAQELEAHIPQEIVQGFQEPLPSMLQGSKETLMRFLHYPPLQPEDRGKTRNLAHEDIGLFTLLPIATQPGLQVLDKAGEWHDVDCAPTTLVINAGDALQHMTGGYLKSTTHRVLGLAGSEEKPRYSLTMFVHPRRTCFLSEGLTAEAFLRQRLQDNGVYPKED